MVLILLMLEKYWGWGVALLGAVTEHRRMRSRSGVSWETEHYWLDLCRGGCTISICSREAWGSQNCLGGQGTLSQEGLDVDVQGRAGHGELKAADDVWMKDPQVSNAHPMGKDFSTAAGEVRGI